MHSVELTEIRKRAEIISARVVHSLQSELKALHARNNAKGRLRSGATVIESSSIARSSIQSYFTELEQFVCSRPDGNAGFDGSIIDAISSSTSALIAAINDGLQNTAALSGDVKRVEVIKPEVDAELSASQETFRSNIRAYWASKMATHSLSKLDKGLLGVEIFCFIASCIIVGMWINDPKGLYESPLLALFGLGLVGSEIYRRIVKKHSS